MKEHPTVLIIDDDDRFIQLAFNHGYRLDMPVEGIEKSQEALDGVLADHPALLAAFLDITMDTSYGLNLYEELRRNHPDVPVVFASADRPNEEVRDVLGRDEKSCFIKKPFSLKTFGQVITSFAARDEELVHTS